MKPIVIQLQEEALDPEVKVSDLLRKAFVVASKLEIKEFKKWIQNELNGYNIHPDDVPHYRKIVGVVKSFNPFHGWMPVVIGNEEIADRLTRNSLDQGVSEIEALLSEGNDFLMMSFPSSIEATMNSWTDRPITQFMLSFSTAQASAALEGVRNVVLQWALKLEKDGILGGGLSFSAKEHEIAKSHKYVINVDGNGANVMIQDNSDNSTQTQVNVSLDLAKIREFLPTLEGNLDAVNLDHQQRESVLKEITAIKDQLQKPEPDKGFIRGSLNAITAILRNTAGSLIASGLIHEIGAILSA